MEVEAISPRGFCHGVVDALTLAKRAARDPNTPRPIFVLGMLVHNHHVVEELGALGVTTLDGADRLSLLEKVPDHSTVIFTAHGISPAVKAQAAARGLYVIDATCSEVTRTHDVIRQSVEDGYHIIYVGTRNHPEPEGAMGVAPREKMALVTGIPDVDHVPFENADRIVVVTQTTLSQWDTADSIAAILGRFPQALVFNEICQATQLRQKAVYEASTRAQAVVVVGDVHSNNTKKLVEVAQNQGGIPAYRIDKVEDLDALNLSEFERVAVSAGSSTPSQITRAVIRRLQATGQKTP